jgi:NADH-quinone oxidoreductase subunit A
VGQYLPIVVLGVLAAAFAALSFFGSRFLGPHRPTAAKLGPYESGIVPKVDPAQRFPVRFYLVAMIFVIFDIEIIFLYPFAVIFHQLDVFGLVEMIVFSVAVLVSLLYLISNGALDWGPPRRLARSTPISTLRTSSSTIRRVPRPQPGAQPAREPERPTPEAGQPTREPEPAESEPDLV